MYSHHLKSILHEKLWLFQLKYFSFYAHWMTLLLPVLWVLSSPYWVLNAFSNALHGKNFVFKAIAGAILGMTLLSSLYLYALLGKPNQEAWEKRIFESHLKRIAIKIYDATDNMIGGLVHRETEVNRGIFYVETVPKHYWDILKFREDRYLDFNNEETGILGLWKAPRSFNGIDAIGIPSAILKQRGGGSSLSQQLVKNFYGQDYFRTQTPFRHLNTLLRKWKELNEAKTFYHNLRHKEGEAFKRWVAMYSPSLVSAGSVYGIESVAAMVFGKKPENLSEYEQILLSNMYKYTHYFNGTAHERKCKKIKHGAKIDIQTFYEQKPTKIKELSQKIDAWKCTNKPRVPLSFYDDMLAEDTKGRLVIGNPNVRIWDWAGTSASVLRYETDRYKEKHPNHLITEAKMTVDIPANIRFKEGVNKALKSIQKRLGSKLIVKLDDNNSDKPQANIWISVVNGKGEIVHLYKRGNTSYKRRIGSASKVFEAIALGNRGDQYNSYYCNEPFEKLHNADGTQGGPCQNNNASNLYSARETFGASKNLPMMSAFSKYVVKNEQGIKIHHKPISQASLEKIYQVFNLQREDQNTTLQYELSFGLTNSTPYNLQKAIHKLTHLLYRQNEIYTEAHISDYLKYKIIEEGKLLDGGKKHQLYRKKLPPSSKKMFDTATRVYMQTVLKAPLNPNFNGTLRSFQSVKGYKALFMKSGTTDKVLKEGRRTQSKWVVGAFKVKEVPYSFVIMVDHEKGIGTKISHRSLMKPIFNEIIKALNAKH